MRAYAIFAAAVLTGCAPVTPPGTVVFASGADLQSINPLVTTHSLARQVQRYVLFTTLVRYDSALRPEPMLARRWSWNADRRTLTFVVRDDVTWHDGRRTTAADAAFTLEAARDPVTGYPRGGELVCLTGASARDDSTLVLTFCRPQDAIPDVLTDLAVLPAHLLAGVPRAAMATAPFNRAPVGNGPWRFVAHEPGRRWVFEPDPRWPAALGGPPALGRLVIAVVDEATTKLAALVAGEVDFAGITPMHASIVRRMAGRAVLDFPLLVSYGLVLNTSRPPFDDVRLRRAVAAAVNRPRLVSAALYGYAEAAEGPVPASHPLAVPVRAPAFDPAAARAALDALGWRAGEDGMRARDGRPLAFTLLTVGASDNILEQVLQADLAAVGIRMRIRQLELGTFLATAQGDARDYDALVTGIIGDLALGYLGALFDSRRRASPLQYAQYADPALDRALDAGDLGAVQHLAARDVPIVFLYHGRGVQGVNTRVRGVRMDLRGELASLAGWHLDDVGSGLP